MACIKIMISEQMLEAVDQSAAEENLSRSAWLQKAAGRDLENQKMEKEAKARKQRMEQAVANMDRLANKFGKWDGVGTIRQFRDRRAGAKR